MSALNAFLLMGAVLMFLVMWIASRFYDNIPGWKLLISVPLQTAIGLLSVHIMAFIEIHDWSGRSFFGVVFLAPILMFPVAKLLRIPDGIMMDLCAPAECVMLALMKVKCYMDGCCYGKVLSLVDLRPRRFPSQIVECVTGLILTVVMLLLIRSGKHTGKVYLWYMIIYGVVRFMLNLLRDTKPWIGPLPAGNFWSLVAITIGTVGMVMIRKKETT